jgi:hypothetical protein
MTAMNVVVERGVARCPRCVAVAEYSFTECGSEYVRYEIRCARCSEVYIEVNCTGPTVFSTDVEQYVYSRPAREGVVMRQLVDDLRQHWATVVAAATRGLHRGLDEIRASRVMRHPPRDVEVDAPMPSR